MIIERDFFTNCYMVGIAARELFQFCKTEKAKIKISVFKHLICKAMDTKCLELILYNSKKYFYKFYNQYELLSK